MLRKLLIVAAYVSIMIGTAYAEYQKAYVGKPFTQDASLSPDGQFVATLHAGTDVQPYWGGDWDEIFIKAAETGDVIRKHSPENRFYNWIDWPFSDVLIANGIEYDLSGRKAKVKTIILAIDPATGNERILAESTFQSIKKELFFSKITFVSKETREIVVSLPGKNDTKLIRLNVDTSAQSVIDQAPKNTLGWDLTSDMQPVLRIVKSSSKLTNHYQFFDTKKRKWYTALTLDRMGKELVPVARQGETTIYSVITRPSGSNFTGLHEFDFATQSLGNEIYVPEDVDLTNAVTHLDGSLIYAGYWKDGFQKHWFDAIAQRYGKLISKAFGSDVNWHILDISETENDWLIFASGPKHPGKYYHFSIDRKKLRSIGKERPDIKTADLGDTQIIKYIAGDGTPLMGYFTPAPHIDGPAHLIVMPHGGPVARDVLDYDAWAQYFARIGYSVFQPQFRGSGGFGRAFEVSGFGEWDGTMRTDIEDGVAALIEAGLVRADLPKAIVGASYGGYAALSAATTQSPDYQCAVSVNGVSDVVKILKQYDQTDEYERFVRDIWVTRIGDPETELEHLQAISPLNRVQNLQAQVLLIHGEDDKVVWIEQSEEMYRAISKAGKFAEFHPLENTGHNGWSDDTSTEILFYMERFIRRCMPTF